jgi:hypothetical protein
MSGLQNGGRGLIFFKLVQQKRANKTKSQGRQYFVSSTYLTRITLKKDEMMPYASSKMPEVLKENK